jgi:hypothetical protein
VAEWQEFHAEIVRRRDRRPFEPFAIVRRDGRRHEVVDWVRIAFNDRFAIVLPPQSTSETVLSTDIAAIEPAH